jgi:hypothetical protein
MKLETLQQIVRSKRSEEKGQQMVEFTLTFGMLTVLLAALVLFAWYFFSYVSLVHATREGSRYLMAHPILPADPVAFATADEEATWVVTNSVPLLDWRNNMTVLISPPVEQRFAGSYVLVEIDYIFHLPQVELPLGFDGTTLTILGPMELHAYSRRSLD